MRNSKLNIGQLLIIGFDGTEMSPHLASLLARIQPAGVILFARNIIGAEQTHTLLCECQKRATTPLSLAWTSKAAPWTVSATCSVQRHLRQRSLPRAAERSFASMGT